MQIAEQVSKYLSAECLFELMYRLCCPENVCSLVSLELKYQKNKLVSFENKTVTCEHEDCSKDNATNEEDAKYEYQETQEEIHDRDAEPVWGEREEAGGQDQGS